MYGRMRILGVVLAVMGLGFLAGGAYAFIKTQEGVASLAALSAAQNVKLSYNEAGQLVDRGETAGAEAIMALLRDDWKYPVNTAELDPNDPVVNTATEYMYQMATISYHTLHGVQTVVLPEDVTAADGTVYKAGTYEFAVDGRYWSDVQPGQPDRGQGSRAGVDRHGPWAHREPGRRDGDGDGPSARPRDRGHLRRHRALRPDLGLRPGLGDAGSHRRRACSEAGPPAAGDPA